MNDHLYAIAVYNYAALTREMRTFCDLLIANGAPPSLVKYRPAKYQIEIALDPDPILIRFFPSLEALADFRRYGGRDWHNLGWDATLQRLTFTRAEETPAMPIYTIIIEHRNVLKQALAAFERRLIEANVPALKIDINPHQGKVVVGACRIRFFTKSGREDWIKAGGRDQGDEEDGGWATALAAALAAAGVSPSEAQ